MYEPYTYVADRNSIIFLCFPIANNNDTNTLVAGYLICID